MKKALFLILACMAAFSGVSAQSEMLKADSTETFGQAVSRIWKNTKQGIKDSGQAIADEFSHRPGEYRVNGTFYMPLYDTNLYKGEDGEKMRDTCYMMFYKRYPQALVQTCVLPQTEWLSETVKKDGRAEGYVSTMYCYVIARDGAEGYLNARFVFKTYKEAGKKPVIMDDSWPKWERTDVIPANDYKKLKEKQ